MLDAHAGADFIEGMQATGLPVFWCETVSELRTVVGQQFDDPGRRGQLEPAQRSTLLLSVSSARDEVIARGQTARADLIIRSGSHETAHQDSDWTPSPLTRSIGFSTSRTMDQETPSCRWRILHRPGQRLLWPDAVTCQAATADLKINIAKRFLRTFS